MLTVLMECRDQESELAQTLSVLVSGAVEGLVSDVIILDHVSQDGSSRVADAAGCRFHQGWDIADVVGSARGEWLLLMEAGARPQAGWIDEVMEYIALGRVPARFAPSRTYRKPFFKRFGRRTAPLEHGLLLPKQQAVTLARSGMDLVALASGHKTLRLASEIVPAWVVSSAGR
jgi:hypothetical protein